MFQGIRGNIQTRLSKLNKEEYDAAVLAAAGVKRLNMEAVIGRYFSVDEVIPAAGQGILAVQGRKEFLKDTVWRQYVDDKRAEYRLWQNVVLSVCLTGDAHLRVRLMQSKGK